MANSLASGMGNLHLENSEEDEQKSDNSPAPSVDLASSITSADLDLATSFTSADLDPSITPELKATVDDLINRCKTLYQEVETYIAAVDANQNLGKIKSPVEYRSLRTDIRSELKLLKKVVGANLSEEKVRHFVTSSNLLYYEALWSAAKRYTGLLAFRKYYSWDRAKGRRGAAKGTAQSKGKSSALVDIVAKDAWVRVSTISEKRLLFELAKLGWWQNCDSDDSDEVILDSRDASWENDDDEDQVDIVRHARDLARAARANPFRGHAPKITFVLTRIESGKTKEIDAVLDRIRATGAILQCAQAIPPPVPLSDVLPNLLIDTSRALSETLNIDCTILLALVSDISHRKCEMQDWYPSEVIAQIKEEAEERLLPTHIYPTIAAHPMVCTQEAADQMNLIVNTLATDTEKLRTNLLLAQNEYEHTSSEGLRQDWAAMSDHAVPEGFALPIRIVKSDISESFKTKLPKVAQEIAKELSPLNIVIFFHGWAEGITTLSSNKTRARQMENLINEHGLEDGETGPHVWLCGGSRSLIAKHGRRGK